MTNEAPDDEHVAGARARGSELRRQLVGTLIAGRYRCLEVIGSGGMGTVYRVEHQKLARQFALKVLHPELGAEPAMVHRLQRESRIAASLSSEHVVAIVDADELDDGSPFFVMELLLGADLRKILRRCPVLSPPRAVNLCIDVCRGLHAAHQKQLVHRDLKPENLMVVRGDDGRELCKILDFGVAKGADNHSTRPGSLLGTVRYMAPEQIGLERPVGALTDVYAVGVILYECLTGVVPFDGDSTERILYRIMTEQPRPLAERCPELPKGLAALVDGALSREPARRPPSALAFAEALGAFAGSRALHPSQTLGPPLLESPEQATLREQPEAAAVSVTVRRGTRSLRRVGSLAVAAALGAGVASVWRAGTQPAPAASALSRPPSQRSDAARAPHTAPLVLSTAPVAPAASSLEEAAPDQAATISSGPAKAATSSAAPVATLGRAAPRTQSSTSEPRRVPATFFDPRNPYAP